jgi:hypothetical protein
MKMIKYRVNMPKIALLAIGSILINLYPASFSTLAQTENIQAGKTCRVTDPTETPLNARLRPNGKVVARIKNGRNVYIQSIDRDEDGKPWVLVAVKNQGKYKILGYVLREFVSCF